MARPQCEDLVSSFRFSVYVDGKGPFRFSSVSGIEKGYDETGKDIRVKPIIMKAALSTDRSLYSIFNVQDLDLNHQVEICDLNRGDNIDGKGILIWKLKDCKVTDYSCSEHNTVEPSLLEETVILTLRDFELIVPVRLNK